MRNENSVPIGTMDKINKYIIVDINSNQNSTKKKNLLVLRVSDGPSESLPNKYLRGQATALQPDVKLRVSEALQ